MTEPKSVDAAKSVVAAEGRDRKDSAESRWQPDPRHWEAQPIATSEFAKAKPLPESSQTPGEPPKRIYIAADANFRGFWFENKVDVSDLEFIQTAAVKRLVEAASAVSDCFGLGQTPEQFVVQVGEFVDELRAALRELRLDPDNESAQATHGTNSPTLTPERSA